MLTYCRLRLPDGAERELVPGDIIGRMPRAALRIDDPRISEAHALVSLRGAELRLLALRGRFSVAGRALTETALEAGLRVVLGGFWPLLVEAVSLPDDVPMIEVAGLAPVPLDGVLALFAEESASGGVRVAAGFDPAAAAIVWPGDEGAHIRLQSGFEAVVRPGAQVSIGATTVGLVLAPRDTKTHQSTLEQGRFDVPLTLVLHYDTVHIQPGEGAAVVLDGLGARLVSELAALTTPIAWQALAQSLWPDEDDVATLRQRLDQIASRVRRRLRDGRVRADLVRSNGLGLIELYLGPSDRIEDRS